MSASKKEKRKAIALSLFLHIILISTLAASGFGKNLTPPKISRPIQVNIVKTANAEDSGKFQNADNNLALEEESMADTVLSEDDGEVSGKDAGINPKAQRMHSKNNGAGKQRKTVNGGYSGHSSPTNGQTVERVQATCISKGAAVYPENMRLVGAEGVVRVRFLVASSGKIESVELIASSGFSELDSAAIAAAWQYRFSPSSAAGIFTDSFIFKLVDDDW